METVPDSPLQRLIRRSKQVRGPCYSRNLPRLEWEQLKRKLKPAAACLCAGLYYLCTVITTMKKTALILTAFAHFHPLRCKEQLSRAVRSGAPQPRRRITDYLTAGLVPLSTWLLHPWRKNPASLGLTHEVIPGPGMALAKHVPQTDGSALDRARKPAVFGRGDKTTDSHRRILRGGKSGPDSLSPRELWYQERRVLRPAAGRHRPFGHRSEFPR